jgi:hypothetical protein
MSTIKSPDLQISKQDVFVTSTNQNTDLGAKATTGDSRYFRYAYVAGGGTTLTPGNVIQSPAQSTSNYEKLAVGAAAIGATQVTLTGSLTITQNALAGGYLTVATVAGSGYTYKIASNTAVSSAVGCVVTLEDPIVVALTTSSTVNMTVSPFNGVIQNPTTATGTPIGIAVSPIAGSSYGWVQTGGPVGGLSDATLAAVGTAISPSTATAGAFTAASGTNTVLGISMQTQTSAQYGMVYLQLD